MGFFDWLIDPVPFGVLVACSILYNRAVYPEESFTKVKKYGLTMLLTQDEGVKTFIASLTSQLSGLLSHLRSLCLLPGLLANALVFAQWFRVAGCCRVAGGREAAADCAGNHEQGHQRGSRALELQHRDRRRGRREGVRATLTRIPHLRPLPGHPK
jgi:hypothetical protein